MLRGSGFVVNLKCVLYLQCSFIFGLSVDFINATQGNPNTLLDNSAGNNKLSFDGALDTWDLLNDFKDVNKTRNNSLFELELGNLTGYLSTSLSMLKCGNSSVKREDGRTYCNITWDGLSCWPSTLSGHYSIIECPDMKGIDTTKNASKFCHLNGTWESKADYNACVAATIEDTTSGTEDQADYARRIIYALGFTISTLALAIALFIFLYFRSLRCLRNKIHCHLMVTYILRNVVWILMQHSLIEIVNSEQTWACKLETAVFNYVQMTNFFWMLVEGLYLHIIIVWTYSADKIKPWYFILIGWGIPVVIINIWIGLRIHFQKHTELHPIAEPDVLNCWLPRTNNTLISGVDKLEFVYSGPILFVLAMNMLFLATIIWVLVTKLRASHSLETRQLRKAVKATLLLLPLLGITYVIFIWPPSNAPAVVEAHQFINAFLQSFQGFFVALFYCFLNGEVKSVIKKKFSVFQDSRTLSARYTKSTIGWANDASIATKDTMNMNGQFVGDYDGCRAGGARGRDYIEKNPEETENML